MKRQIYLSSSEVRIKLTKNKSRNKKANVNFCFQNSENLSQFLLSVFQVLNYMRIFLEQSFTCKGKTEWPQSFWEWQKTPPHYFGCGK